MNRSIISYRASGGSLSGLSDPREVLAALKSKVSASARLPGFTGSTIDERLSLTLNAQGGGSSSGKSAFWDATAQRFVVADSGNGPAIGRFILDDNAIPAQDTERKVSPPLLYGSQNSWVWDYSETAATAPPGSSSMPVGEVPDSTPTPPAPPSNTPLVQTPLTPPQYSLAGGTYPITSFNLNLSLSNPNPPGASDLYYSVDYGSWQLYSAPLTVSPDSVIAAQAIAVDTTYSNSARVERTYSASPANLNPPVISPSAPEFGLFDNRTLTITISNQNSSSISMIEYRIGGDPWQTYSVPFTLDRDAYPGGTLVQARAIPLDPNYIASTATLRTLAVEEASITGTTTGSFSDPIGQKLMTTNLAASGSADRFAWGRTFYTATEITNLFAGDAVEAAAVPLSQSWLEYNPVSFNAVQAGKRFQIGEMDYFNGTIVIDTAATAVTFTANLDLKMNGVTANAAFDFDFELINQPNYEDPNDPWKDADFVKLASPVSSQTVSFRGVEYQLQLEFGDATSTGLALFDEFYVLEGKSATTKLYGTLVEVGTVSFNN
ncbi:MAG: choice-of-anchor K domain-containing protein [Verrucomicrobiae bacterium]|nr:choice-of-anchor K domain-containing protein [Verrucomicrobiae bacterium]